MKHIRFILRKSHSCICCFPVNEVSPIWVWKKNYSSLAIAGSHLMHASDSVFEGTIKCQKFSKHCFKSYPPIINNYSFLKHNSVTKWIFSAEPHRNIYSWCNTLLTCMVGNQFRNIFRTDLYKGKTDNYFMTIIDQFWKSYQWESMIEWLLHGDHRTLFSVKKKKKQFRFRRLIRHEGIEGRW